MRADRGAGREGVLKPLADRVATTSNLTPGWEIAIASEGFYSSRSAWLPEPLDSADDDGILRALRLGPSWNYTDPNEITAERTAALATFRALAEEGKIQLLEPDQSTPGPHRPLRAQESRRGRTEDMRVPPDPPTSGRFAVAH